MGTLFGTDGIRGIANDTLDNVLAYRVGQATAYQLWQQKGSQPVVAIGKDTRISSDMLEAALSAGLCAGGATVVQLGVVPTPSVAYLTVKHHADTGIVISASHNPFEYNGIKMFSGQGFKLNDQLEEAIERMVLARGPIPVRMGADIGQIFNGHHTLEEYTAHLVSTVTEEIHDLHLLKTERPVPDMFTLYFTASSDTLPVLKGLNFEGAEDMILERSLHNDTLTYWITDTLVSNLDTLRFSLTYLDTDTLGQLVPRTDTLDLISKISRSRQKEERQKKIEAWEDQQKKLKRRQKEKYVAKPNPHLREDFTYKAQPGGSISPLENIKFTFAEPIASVDSAALHFYQYDPKDSTWNDAPFANLYLNDFKSIIFPSLGNTNSPEVRFEGTNYDTVISSYLK